VTELFAMLVFVLLSLAVVLELAIRRWIRARAQYYVLPPGLRLRLYPDLGIFPTLEPVVRFEVNSEGERGREVPRAVDGLYRVLVAGGSQPEGYLLDQDTAWPGALHRLLETPAHLRALETSTVHVGNIARSGVGSEALDLIFERVLGRYPRLQMIVVLVGASDVLRWLEAGAPSSPVAPVPVSDVFRCHPELISGWQPRELALVELCRRLRRHWWRPVDVHRNAGRWIGKARAMRAHAKVIRTTMPAPDTMLDHFELHFRKALQKAKAHADRVLVVRQPWFDARWAPDEAACMWHGGIGKAWQEELTDYYSLPVLSRLMAHLDARAAEVARDLDVEQLDLMPILEPSLDNYYDFFHVTPVGSRAIAAAVADTILRPISSVHTATPGGDARAELQASADARAS